MYANDLVLISPSKKGLHELITNFCKYGTTHIFFDSFRFLKIILVLLHVWNFLD